MKNTVKKLGKLNEEMRREIAAVVESNKSLAAEVAELRRRVGFLEHKTTERPFPYIPSTPYYEPYRYTPLVPPFPFPPIYCDSGTSK